MKKILLSETQRAALQSGDIVFIAEWYPVCRMIAATSRSWESHVGILFREPDGRLVVAESCVPFTSITPLERFLARTSGGRFAVHRLAGGVTTEQAASLREAAERRLGKIYHHGFNFDSRGEFCSKFVYGCYREALGVEVGQLETFEELFARNPAAPQWFWRLCFFGLIPWQRRTVTPNSQLQSPLLQPVLTATD